MLLDPYLCGIGPGKTPLAAVLPTVSVSLPALCITQIDWKKPRSNMLDDNEGDRERGPV